MKAKQVACIKESDGVVIAVGPESKMWKVVDMRRKLFGEDCRLYYITAKVGQKVLIGVK